MVGTAGGTAYDTITDFTAGTDKFAFGGPSVTTVDGAVSGALDVADFDNDLAALLGHGASNELDQGHAVLFTATGGGALGGHVFLVVGTSAGASGYAAGADYVIDVTTGNTTGLAAGDFI